jgi:hypothetical protein
VPLRCGFWLHCLSRFPIAPRQRPKESPRRRLCALLTTQFTLCSIYTPRPDVATPQVIWFTWTHDPPEDWDRSVLIQRHSRLLGTHYDLPARLGSYHQKISPARPITGRCGLLEGGCATALAAASDLITAGVPVYQVEQRIIAVGVTNDADAVSWTWATASGGAKVFKEKCATRQGQAKPVHVGSRRADAKHDPSRNSSRGKSPVSQHRLVLGWPCLRHRRCCLRMSVYGATVGRRVVRAR